MSKWVLRSSIRDIKDGKQKLYCVLFVIRYLPLKKAILTKLVVHMSTAVHTDILHASNGCLSLYDMNYSVKFNLEIFCCNSVWHSSTVHLIQCMRNKYDKHIEDSELGSSSYPVFRDSNASSTPLWLNFPM